MHLFQLHSFKERRFYFSYFSRVEMKQGTVSPSEKFQEKSFGNGSQGLGKVQKRGQTKPFAIHHHSSKKYFKMVVNY